MEGEQRKGSTGTGPREGAQGQDTWHKDKAQGQCKGHKDTGSAQEYGTWKGMARDRPAGHMGKA